MYLEINDRANAAEKSKTWLEHLKTGLHYLSTAVGVLTITIKLGRVAVKYWPVVKGVLLTVLEEAREEQPEAVALIEANAGRHVLDLTGEAEKVGSGAEKR